MKHTKFYSVDSKNELSNLLKNIDKISTEAIIASLKLQRSALLSQQEREDRFSAAVRFLESATGCFVCGYCEAFSTWQPESFIEHLRFRHTATQHSSVSCLYCFDQVPLVGIVNHQAGHFAAVDHLSDRIGNLSHCPQPGCLVKSPSYSAVRSHVDRCHSDEQPVKLFEKVQTDALDARFQCPDCQFGTSSWERFVTHQTAAGCSGLVRCKLSYCSECGLAATESALIDEHAVREHPDGAAFRIDEEVTSRQVLESKCSAPFGDHLAAFTELKIREPVKRPNSDSHADVCTKKSARAGDDAPAAAAAAPDGQLHFGQNASHFEAAEGVDEEEISLPFSESALRHLLRDVFSESDQLDSLMRKMRAYSAFSLVRQARRGRTVAYKCQCGRVFHTVRRPNSSVRPSTLADARRHVMGVHARIGHDLLTVCCQASRISRENNWQLYTDQMLLRLATDRPGRAANSAQKSLDRDDFASLLYSPSSQASSMQHQQQPGLPIQPHEEASEEQRLSTLASLAESELERVIDLPYSWTALQALMNGVCDQATMAALRTKMDYYSTYKVAVTRGANRRAFHCSGCSATSPHGMGDIRKHILGVHAKVPDRYKTACMHASRLSRDDNRLLPDQLLLHLAKLKWKGTTSVGSTRGASQRTDSRRNSDFNLIDQPFKSVTPAENGPAAADNADEPDDDADSEPVEMAPTQLRPSVPDGHHVVKLAPAGGSGTPAYSCNVCQLTASAVGPIRGHIVRHHLGIPGHKCSLCGRLFALRRHVFRHHQLAHPDREFRLLQYSPYRYAMNRVAVK